VGCGNRPGAAVRRRAAAGTGPLGSVDSAAQPSGHPRNLFPRLSPKLIAPVQLLGSSSLMATPCEADFS